MAANSSQDNALKQALTNRQSDPGVITPRFFRLGNNEDRNELQELLQQKPYISVFDTIDEQLRELIKSSFPKRTLTPSEIATLQAEYLDGIPKSEYGVWVYYPWNEKLVHILDEREFVSLRTNRNRYKITGDEQLSLMKKKVGVIGLSVGQSVSLTLCMERGCGELRIADFDELEITNLNRLRSGVHNLGLKKTVVVAREIAEIDPFLKVTCFHEGITSDNLEKFLLQDGKLDVLIDECDGVDVKVNCRIAAKKHRIPVLMEASDRGTVDVERFDLEPDRPILHGFVEHLDLSGIEHVKTNEEKLPYILAFAGVETLSVRMKASAMEVGQTISTWPQLASAVVMGGGIMADICRRVLLGHYHQSGRFFIDLEQLMSDPEPPTHPFEYTEKSLNTAEMIQAAKRVRPIGKREESTISEWEVKALVKAAASAPSPGNNQPWKWYHDGKQLFLFHDIERSESYGDFQNMASYMALGTAIENMTLKARELGIGVIEEVFPLMDEQRLVAVFSFERSQLPKDDLVNYIGQRCTNRKLGDGSGIKPSVLAAIQQSIEQVPDARLRLVTDRKDLEQLASIMGKADKLRLFIPQGHYELFEKELRWSAEEAEITRDGLDIRTLELAAKDEIGFRVARDARAMELIAQWNLGEGLENISGKSIVSSSVGLITMPRFDGKSCVAAGKAVERLWLTATRNSVSLHPMLAAVLHFARIRYGNGADMPTTINDQFKILEKQFNALFEIDPSVEVPLFLFRLFEGENPIIRSLRFELEDVFLQPGA